ncbi:MAG TPA: hypothetical protein VKT28_16825 [Puia sp.]|nr:hypothetical protein [Puia sp.]
MKKWILLLIPMALIASIYILIPSRLTVSKTIKSSCNIEAADRFFSDTSKWIKWWPQNKQHPSGNSLNNNSFAHDGCNYRIAKLLYNNVNLLIDCGDVDNIGSDIRIASLDQDSILIGWEFTVPTSKNPFKKIIQYQHAKHIEKSVNSILASFKSFIEDTKSVYGVDFHQTMSKDSTLVSMTSVSATYPTTQEIYKIIDTLKTYISSQGAKEINYPMLNVSKKNGTEFIIMIAISVNKVLDGNNRIAIKRFVPWKMLEGEVHGGVYSVDKAFEQFYNYKNDHQHSIMALPFQSLVTDRSKEQDTTKWVTKICAPIS